MRDKKVLKYEDIVLRDSDLDTLGESRYLNDQIIAFYFTYLSSNLNTKTDTLLVLPSICHLIANCEDDKSVEGCVQSCKMSSKRVVVFVVNNEDFSGGDSGTHWSTLVYDRMKNLFLHFDSSEGAPNSFYAEKLYNAVKEHMGPGGEVARPQTSSSSLKKQRNKKKSVPSVTGGTKATAPAGLPEFMECGSTPQQENGSDCGLYVLAIAREVCRWCSREHNKSDMITTIKKNVDSSVEMKMRREVLKIIKDLTTDV